VTTIITAISIALVSILPQPLDAGGAGGASDPGTDAVRTVRGTASHVGYGYGRHYLALPSHKWGKPGITVTICGAGGCITRTSTDAGPSLAMQRAGRVADLNAWDFETVCGLPPSRGLCAVTVRYGGAVSGPVPTPPATDS
jgi:hypothetical protein